MNSSGGSGNGPMVGIIIFVIVLLLLGVGGYFGYTKWYKPRSCNNRAADTKLNIASWMYDDKTGNCVANACSSGYGTDANGTPANTTNNGDAATCPVFCKSDGSVATFSTDGKCTPLTCSPGYGDIS
jgi:hypothetical protein